MSWACLAGWVGVALVIHAFNVWTGRKWYFDDGSGPPAEVVAVAWPMFAFAALVVAPFWFVGRAVAALKSSVRRRDYARGPVSYRDDAGPLRCNECGRPH